MYRIAIVNTKLIPPQKNKQLQNKINEKLQQKNSSYELFFCLKIILFKILSEKMILCLIKLLVQVVVDDLKTIV